MLLIFWGILLVSLVQAQESKSPIFSFSKSYPDYVVFLPEGKIDSVFIMRILLLYRLYLK